MATKKLKETVVSLINDVSRLFESQMRFEMSKNGMKTSYRHLLQPLATKDGVTQLDLVKISRLKAPTVSTTLRNMQQDGLVSRETDKDDARATRVFLTDKGKEIDKKMRNSKTKVEKQFLTCLSLEEQAQLLSLLKKMKQNIEKASFADPEY
ncbi:MAG: MarR family transcriptional regulator [Eubacterium sp.]|jgi:DNA-binding MarR family transcriptional regulator|nr:MarR family transcriptional regulator [Eubacterium sp.]